MNEKHEKKPESIRRLSVIFWLTYFVQKVLSTSEGVSNVPLRKLVKSFGLEGKEAGQFFTVAGLGWYIKGLLGLLTDRLPIFGYRRKSWLIVSLVGTGVAWTFVAVGGATSTHLLLTALLTVNLLVAFSDVVADGLMIEKGQELESRGIVKEGTGNRRLQAAQWTGGFSAMLLAAVAGGVIAQIFDLAIAAVISAVLPFGLALLVFFFVKEQRVAFDWQKAKLGVLAIGVIAVVSVLVLWIKGMKYGVEAWQKSLFEWEWLITPALILGAILSLYRPGRAMVLPALLIVLWQGNPFGVDSQWLYQYFTQDAHNFLEALKSDTGLVPLLQKTVVNLKMTTYEEIAESGVQEMFFGSVLTPFQACFSIIGVFVFGKYWRETPLSKLFIGAIGGVFATTTLFLAIPAFGITSLYYVLAINCAVAFVKAVAFLAILSYAASVCPKENQATAFAFLMGLSNLALNTGSERVGNQLYALFGDEKLIADKSVIANPDAGFIGVAICGLAFLFLVSMFLRFLAKRGYVDASRK